MGDGRYAVKHMLLIQEEPLTREDRELIWEMFDATYEAWAQEAAKNRGQVLVRGVDFKCESCGELKGSHLDNGWYRCLACGYPSK